MKNPFLFYDLETTGLPNWELPADHPDQPRIIEIAAILCDSASETLDVMDMIVKPDGWEIGAEVAAIHGITQKMALEKGQPIATVMGHFDAMVAKAGTLATFNLRFDEKIIRGERRRLGKPDGFGTVPVFCCMRAAKPICKIPAKKGNMLKNPKLGEAVKLILGRDHVGAHRAIVDACAARDIYFAMRDNAEFMAAGSAFKSNEGKNHG